MGATGGTLTDPTGPVVEVPTSSRVDGRRRPHRRAGLGGPSERHIARREPLEGRDVHPGAARRRRRARRTGLPHRRPPPPWNIGVTPDPEIAATLEQLEVDLAPTLARDRVGGATDSASRRLRHGDRAYLRIADRQRHHRRVADDIHGFRHHQLGGIRADLTCPPEGSDVCPTDAGELPITEGQVLTVLPFGNVAVTVEVWSGAEGDARGRCSGDARGVGSVSAGIGPLLHLRHRGGTGQSRDRCRAAGGRRDVQREAIDLSEAATYTIATNDFTASGGDNYPPSSPAPTRATSWHQSFPRTSPGSRRCRLPGEPLDPKIEGRIVCEGEGCPAPAGG